MIALLTHPAAFATVYPALLVLAVAYPLRPRYGRRTAGLIVRVPAGWNPLTPRQQATARRLAHLSFEDRPQFVNAAR